MAAKIKGLQLWCRKMTEGYPHVDISNFTTAWRNGLAFCAIIHRFRPDLIDYDSLSPENVFENNKLAFEVGESELNIPAFLEADDMARLKVPDKLSVITYVSQYYNYLGNLPQLGGPGVKGAVKKKGGVAVSGTKRPPDTSTKVASEPSNKKTVSAKEDANNVANSSTASSPRKGTLGDKCGICNNKVYLLERHIDSGKLYHRSCYRHSDLSPTNKVLTKSPFMAPSLHNEKAYKGHGVKDTSQTPVNDSRGKYNNGNDKQKENESSSVLANLKSGLKRVEAGSGSVASGVGVGSKHTMQADKDKEEDAKKAKVQPRNLFGGSGTGKENTNNVSTGRNESVYPLSGKEAKKLEKRRQEILASENSTPINKGAKRGMPLIFQTKDQSLPSPSSASASSSSSSSTNKMSSGSDGSGDGIAVKFSSNASVSLLNSKSKDSKTTPSTGVGNEPNKGNAVQNLQQKFSGQSQSSSDIESHVTGVGANPPTARPRIAGSKIASSPFLDNDNNKTGNGSVHTGPTTSDPVSIRNKKDVQVNASTPVAAPRKSVAGNIGDAKLAAPQKDALSKVAHSSLLSHESSSSDDNGTPRSARSKSSSTSSTSSTSNPPPALPLSLPPSLPQSKPPPLPTTPPPQVSASTTTKHSRSSSPSSSSDAISTSSADKDCRKDLRHLHPSSSSSSSTPSSSSVATTAKISLKPVNPPPPTPSDKKGEGGVLSGLLASLAGVRGRSASTPNSLTTAQQQQQQPTSHKDPGTTATPKAVSKLASTAITTTTTTTPSLTVLSSTTSNRKHSEPAIKTGDLTVDVTFPVPVPSTDQQSNHGPALKKVIPNSTPASSSSSSVHNAGSKSEAVNVLNSLKPVAKTNATSTTTVSSGSKPSETVMSHKSKDTINENKVGSLVKNYLSKSKEDLSSSGCQHSKQAVHSNSEDVFKKVSKPPGAKDAIRDGPHKDGPNVGSDRFNVGLKKGESNKNEDKMKTDATPVSTRYDVKLKKVGIPNDPGKVDTVGPRQVVNHKMEDEGRKEKPSTLDVPQWKKDIEDRKKKLREDIIRSETPSKWTQKNDKDKEKALPTKDVAPKVLPTKDVAPKVLPTKDVAPKVLPTKDVASKVLPTKDVAPKVLPTKDVAPKVLPTKDVAPKVLPTKDVAPKPEEPTPKPVKTPSSSKEDRNKLNWQLEAERRMAAFALFDGEEESKSQDGDFKMEGKMAEMNEQRKREAGLKVNKLKDVNESTKHKTKIGLKSVDIDIGVLGVSDKRGNDLSKAQSINNNNSLTLAEDKKPVKDISSPRSDTKDKTVLNNKVEDGKLSVDKEKDTVRKPASPKVSPKLKRKITVLGPKNQKNANQEPSVSPPTTPSVTQEKKKIAVTGMFDFDNDSASSDFESSLSLSTGQMSLEEDQTPHRPPRTKSHRNKAESPKQISAIELQQQLMEIDNRLTDLELRGRDLEDSIRNASFQEGSSEAVSTNNNDDYDDDDDHLMMEWFQLVSEKNDLVRQEADLVYLSREQDLEDEQEQLDHQLRYLLGKEEMIKSPQEKEEESYLLQRKVDIVNQRSSIIESMDEDRLRYEEEDRGIEYVLKSKGLWKDDDGTFLAEQGRIVGNSTFFA